MRLNDTQIKALAIDYRCIRPFDEMLLASHSYDCTLNSEIKIQTEIPDNWEDISIKNSKYLLRPGEFILASTKELFNMPKNIEGYVQGKSSLGRKGLQIECAGFIDPLFHGEITLEIFNMSRWVIILEDEMPIAQVLFTNVLPAEIKPYDKFGHYMYQKGPTVSKS